MSASRRMAPLVAAMLLAACASVETEKSPPVAVSAPEPEPPAVTQPEPPVVTQPVPPAPAPEPAPALRALDFYAHLKERPQREQRQEVERLRKSFAGSRSDHDRVRLALALTLTGAAPGEESQALELLEPLVRDSRNDYHDLASLVAMLLSEQRRRGEQAAALQLKLERIKALEREMQERSSARGSRPR